jgi:hypothetical protein
MTWSESLRRFVTIAVLCASGCGRQNASREAPVPADTRQLSRASADARPDAESGGGDLRSGKSEPVLLDRPAVVTAGLEEAVRADTTPLENAPDAKAPAGPVRNRITDEADGAAAAAEPAPLSMGGAFPLAPDSTTVESPAGDSAKDVLATAPAAEDAPQSAADTPAPSRQSLRGDAPSAPATDSNNAQPLTDQEPLFVGWSQPKLALVFTGQQHGYLEPCGCSGLENQKGGLVRRNALLRQLAAQGWPVVPIDAGNQVQRFGRQSEIKFSITVDGLRKMGYQAIAFGPDDLRLPGPELVVVVAPSGDTPSPFVCANVTVLDPSYTSPFLVIEKAGKKIGVTSVLGARNQKQVNNDDITLRGAEEGLNEVWPKLQRARCDLYVLIAHASMEESIALAQRFPQFTLVVSTGGAGEPTLEPEMVEGTRSQLIQIGTKGMYACVVGLFDDRARPLRYQRVPLDARFPDSDEMLQLLAAYQDQLKEAGFEGLGIRPQPHPSGRAFAGSASCAECHENAWKVWKDGLDGNPSKHARAYATLQQPPKRGKIPRNFDPECLSCHVVGWNPQKYFPYQSGFMSLESTPELTDVGCENCHGPGAEHVAAENGDVELDEAQIDKLRKELVLPLKDAEQKCLECHDLDNSPAFQEEGAFERYWEKIKHVKKPGGKTTARVRRKSPPVR